MSLRNPLVLFLPLMLNGCFSLFSCSNDVVKMIAAPDGRHDAVIFQRNCGATTGFSTQISIVAHGKKPSDAGNVFIADDDHGKAAAAHWGGPWADMSWVAPDRLLVTYDRDSRVGTKRDRVEGVGIVYRTIAADDLHYLR